MLNLIGWIVLLLVVFPLGTMLLNGLLVGVAATFGSMASLFAEENGTLIERLKVFAATLFGGLFLSAVMTCLPILIVFLIFRYMIGAEIVSHDELVRP